MEENIAIYLKLMEEEEYEELFSLLMEDIEEQLKKPPLKRTKKDKQLLDYSKRLLRMVEKERMSFKLINKIAKIYNY